MTPDEWMAGLQNCTPYIDPAMLQNALVLKRSGVSEHSEGAAVYATIEELTFAPPLSRWRRILRWFRVGAAHEEER